MHLQSHKCANQVVQTYSTGRDCGFHNHGFVNNAYTMNYIHMTIMTTMRVSDLKKGMYLQCMKYVTCTAQETTCTCSNLPLNCFFRSFAGSTHFCRIIDL